MEKIVWWRTLFGEAEIRKLTESVYKEYISQGSVTEEFEANLAKELDVSYVVVTTSGSVALLMALMALGIQQGDEVILPDRTWIATANAILFLGAKPVLVDVNPDIPTMDIRQVRDKITSKTKAIMPVHLNGRAVDMDEIHKIAHEHGLYVVEDACQALFSKNSKGYLGTESDTGCFSLGVTKLISTGQGGFVVTQDRNIYQKLKLIRNQGVVDLFTDTWGDMGFNFKFTDLQASFGVIQLERAAGRISHLKSIYEHYKAALAEFDFLKLVPVKEGEVPLYIEVLCEKRKELVELLNINNIQARPVPPNIHTSSFLNIEGDFPNSDIFGSQGIYLPCGPDQPVENVHRVIDTLWDWRI